MASPLSASNSISTSPVINLVLRVLSFIFILISLIIITTITFKIVGYAVVYKFHFNDVMAYRYMLFTLVVGFVYMLLQSAFAIYHATMGKRISNGLYLFDFYADKVISYTLATGTAAAFGVTTDLKIQLVAEADDFLNKGNAAASLLLFAFIFSAISSILSSLALSKRD